MSGRYLRLLFEDGTQDLDEDAVQLMEVSVYATDYSGIPGTGENTNVNYAALALLLSSVTVAGILIYKKLKYTKLLGIRVKSDTQYRDLTRRGFAQSYLIKEKSVY